jgi:glutamate N-acetyltransferase/amino-acid N-acetyltransferase
MKAQIEFIPGGGVTSAKGFRAGAVYAGIKKKGSNALDLGIVCSDVPCTVAGVFTTNQVKAAPVVLTQQRVAGGMASAVIVNSGCANACTGEVGLKDAEQMAALAAERLGLPPQDVLVASTGVIGKCLPMDKIAAGVKQISPSADGGHDFTRAIMTTDTVPKEVSVTAGDFTVGGTVKGSGMIHPNMATMLCFLTTDAGVEKDFLKESLLEVVNTSFNMVSVDGDTSTNDMVLVMANGLSQGEVITRESSRADIFRDALRQVCIYLAKAIARDGEGATKLIEVIVSGAASEADAGQVARTIAGSSLVKTAVHGSDPNWGRILAAAGRSRVKLEVNRLNLDLGDIPVVRNGQPVAFSEKAVVALLDGKEIFIHLNLNLGGSRAVSWGCDLSAEYVKINSEYTT